MTTSDSLFRTEEAVSAEAAEETAPHLALWQKLLLSLSIIGAVLWLGGSVVRTAIAYDLFVPGTLDFKPDMPPMAEAQSLRLYAITSFYTIIGYSAAFVGFLPVFLSLRGRWRYYGWLFVAGMLFLLYVPFEGVQIWFDTRLVRLVDGAGLDFDVTRGKVLLLHSLRLDFLGDVGTGVRLLAFLGYMSAIVILVWRPLHKRFPETPER